MKLLLDENLSCRLAPALQVICTKDDDFHRLVAARGYRPRLLRLALGNAGNDATLAALVRAAQRVRNASDDPGIGAVIIE